MCLLSDSIPILRAMVGDTIVPPAPPSITDQELIELIKASVLMHGVTCTSVVQNAGVWSFSPCPPNGDTLAYILQGAASVRLGAENPISYRTRAISYGQHPQGLADMRRYAENLMVDIEARGNVCNLTPVAGGLISVCLDLVAQSYPFVHADCCGGNAGKEIVNGGSPAPVYAPQTVLHRVQVPAGVDSVSITPPAGKELASYVPGSAALEWAGVGAVYSLGLTGSHAVVGSQIVIHLLSQAVTTGDYNLVTLWR